MQHIVSYSLLLFGVVLAGVCNAIWYQAKHALKRKGYPVNYLSNHLRDFNMIDKAVAEETDPAELERLRLIQRRMKSIWRIFPVAAISFFLGTFLR